MNRSQPGAASPFMGVEIAFAGDFDAFADAQIRAQLVPPLNADP